MSAVELEAVNNLIESATVMVLINGQRSITPMLLF